MVLGIKELQELLVQQFIVLALNKADNYRWREMFSNIRDTTEEVPDDTVELKAVH